jgi:hypothetical protein
VGTDGPPGAFEGWEIESVFAAAALDTTVEVLVDAANDPNDLDEAPFVLVRGLS